MEKSDSVYQLITELCGKFTNDPEIIRKYRQQSYEILLKYKHIKHKSAFGYLESADVITNVYAWQFTLATKYNLKEPARKLVELTENVHKVYGDDIIKFLMQLRQIPNNSDDSEAFSLDSLLQPYKTESKVNQIKIVEVDENLGETNRNSPDIWEQVLDENYSRRRTWACFGRAEADKEPLFLSELSGSLWLKNLPSTYNNSNNNNNNNTVIQLDIKTIKQFVKDLKYLLVGMASYSFNYNEQLKKFYLLPNLTVEGISRCALEILCKELLVCGNYFKQLHNLTTLDQFSGKYKQEGYIFAELCKSVGRYLQLYRYVIIKLPNNINLLNFIDKTIPLRNQLLLLTELCQIRNPTELSIEHKLLLNSNSTNSISFLNYLYRIILNEYDKKLLSVLLSILYAMLQTYNCKFLQPWLFYGIIDDQFNEFFVQLNPDYTKITIDNNNGSSNSNSGRYFWMKCFKIRYDIIPDFLENLHLLIFDCGRSMNLLKLCNKSNPLCLYLLDEKPYIFSSCFTLKQLNLLKKNLSRYCRNVEEICGKFFKLEDFIKNEQQQDRKLLELIKKHRVATLKRIELEQQNRVFKENQKKFEQIKAVKDDLDLQLALKQERRAQELQQEIQSLETDLIVEQTKNDLIEEEAKEMVEYYGELCEIVDKQKQFQQNELISLTTDKSTNLNNLKSNQPKLETFEIAEKIKEDVLKIEYDITIVNNNIGDSNHNTKIDNNRNLTEAQKNKLKVLGSEFGINLMESQINNNYLHNNDNTRINNANRTKLSLNLDNNRIIDKPTPMSIDSTPLSDLTVSTSTTITTNRPSSSLDCFDKLTPETGSSKITENCFNFNEKIQQFSTILTTNNVVDDDDDDNNNNNNSEDDRPIFSKQMSVDDVKNADDVRLFKIYLHEGLLEPIRLHLRFINNELLKFYFVDLNYLKHLKLLRNFYFLQDGEFSCNLTDNLYEKLYNCVKPKELINCRILQNLIQHALNYSSYSNDADDDLIDLSFRINSLPKQFRLRDPNVLDCLSLVYKIKWPLNILLTQDTINKYDEVFKYLLKLNRVSWVLKKINLELKILVKEIGNKGIYLISSPHYRKLHQYRHVMLHVIQTLQNYIIGEVLQPSWEIFLNRLQDVTDLDQLYSIHTNYIKNILFLCLLNQKSKPLRKIIENIFFVILKFYDCLRSRNWKISNGFYVHPNFEKLDTIYKNFDEFVLYFFKICRKVIKTGYQSHLIQLLDVLDINGYYTKKLDD